MHENNLDLPSPPPRSSSLLMRALAAAERFEGFSPEERFEALAAEDPFEAASSADGFEGFAGGDPFEGRTSRATNSNVFGFTLSNDLDRPNRFNAARYHQLRTWRRSLNIPILPEEQLLQRAAPTPVSGRPSPARQSPPPTPQNDEVKSEENKEEKPEFPKENDDEDIPPTFRWVHIEIV